MKKKNTLFKNKTALGVVALALVVGAFSVASGDVLDSTSSLMASVYTALSGQPAIIIVRDSASPTGSIESEIGTTTLAIYDIKVKNVSNWANFHYMSLNVDISSQLYSQVAFSNFASKYTYCIPVGARYGYGWTSAGTGCSTTIILPTSVTKTDHGYSLTFAQDIPLYPQESQSTFSIMGMPFYRYTGTTTESLVGQARIQAKVTGGYGAGDQCTTWLGFNNSTFGYSGCTSRQAIINLATPRGFVLTVQRHYGYGYLPKK